MKKEKKKLPQTCGLFSPKESNLFLFQELWLGPNIGIRAKLQ